jgi:hypothetical protein
MKYEKPEIVELARALSAVQGTKNGPKTDAGICTPNAYEADE